MFSICFVSSYNYIQRFSNNTLTLEDPRWNLSSKMISSKSWQNLSVKKYLTDSKEETTVSSNRIDCTINPLRVCCVMDISFLSVLEMLPSQCLILQGNVQNIT